MASGKGLRRRSVWPRWGHSRLLRGVCETVTPVAARDGVQRFRLFRYAGCYAYGLSVRRSSSLSLPSDSAETTTCPRKRSSSCSGKSSRKWQFPNRLSCRYKAASTVQRPMVSRLWTSWSLRRSWRSFAPTSPLAACTCSSFSLARSSFFSVRQGPAPSVRMRWRVISNSFQPMERSGSRGA